MPSASPPEPSPADRVPADRVPADRVPADRGSPPDASGPDLPRGPRHEEESIGGRDLAEWRTELGRRMAGTAVAAARRVRPLQHWAIANIAIVVTALVGGLAVFLLDWGTAELYESVKEGDGLAAMDRPVLDAAVAMRTPVLDQVVTAYTDIGGPIGMPVVAIVVVVLLTLRWRRWTPVVLMGLAAAGSLAMTVAGKHLVGRARPPLSLAVPPYEHSPSFPSGHSLNAAVVLGVTAYLLLLRSTSTAARVATLTVATVLILAMGLSRVFLGHHWLTDVIAGWLLGLGWLGVIVVGHRLAVTLGRSGEHG